jgi:hypothetical protein
MKLNCTNCGEYVGSDIADEIERLQDKLLRAVSVLKELRDDGLSDRYVQDEARNKRVRAVIAENEGAAERLVGVEDWRDGSRPREAAAEIDRLREARNLAYGLLWTMKPIDRGNHKDDVACRAREALLATMTKDDQIAGIVAAKAALKGQP